MKFNELGRSFFRKMVQIRSNFATTCTIRGTRGAKLQENATFSGRSMVEMLGVLAIIGVLSVGALSGYSKAMMKYKLNKWVEQITSLINIGFRYAGKWSDSAYSVPNNLTSYYIKLNEIPETMIHSNDPNRIYDIFGNTIQINSSSFQSKTNAGCISSTVSSYAPELCRQIITIAKEYADNLYNLEILTNNVSAYYWGPTDCNNSVTCIKDLDMSACNIFTDSNNKFAYKIWWKD